MEKRGNTENPPRSQKVIKFPRDNPQKYPREGMKALIWQNHNPGAKFKNSNLN